MAEALGYWIDLVLSRADPKDLQISMGGAKDGLLELLRRWESYSAVSWVLRLPWDLHWVDRTA